jgi:hypothetical protein
MSITVDPRPQVGAESIVQLAATDDAASQGGTPVRAILRAGLPGQHEVALGFTDTNGQVLWTPKEPGATVLEAGDRVEVVHVAPDAPPIDLLVHLAVLAGLLAWLARAARAPR